MVTAFVYLRKNGSPRLLVHKPDEGLMQTWPTYPEGMKGLSLGF
ncbi:MAG TPA: hypothetical protein VN939_08200 [Chthoniobacterales bacterium]|nr:hypothetical protein [Chthoniobacterales bacterium]